MMHVNEIITNNIVKQLESGIIPWEKPWFGSAMTGNGVSNKPYSLLNQMLLSHAGLHYSYKQLQAKKAKLVKPENWYKLSGEDWDKISEGQRFSALSDIVTFWKVDSVEATDANGKTIMDENGFPKMRNRFTLRYYRVIWEGYTSIDSGKRNENNAPRIDSCDALIKYYSNREGIKIIEETGSQAFFRPSTDSIHLPSFKQFKAPELFYATAFHEMTHSTGVEKRLNRDMSGSFGSQKYAREELTAELGSAFLSNRFGIRTDKVERDNVAYIQSWLNALKKDADLIVKAASKADKAAEFITEGFEEPEVKETPIEKEPEVKAPKALISACKKVVGKTGKVAKLDEETYVYLNKGASLAILAGYVGIPVNNDTLTAETMKRITPQVDAVMDVPDLKEGRTALKKATAIFKKRPMYAVKVGDATVNLTLFETAVKAAGKNARIHYITGSPSKPIMVSGDNCTAIVCPMRATTFMEVKNGFGYLA